VTVLEGADRLVPSARPEHSAYVLRFLERRGVRVHLLARVTRVEDKRVHTAEGPPHDAFTILWTAGVHPPELVRRLPFRQAKDGRVRVDEFLRPLGLDERPVEGIHVIGDCAASLRDDGKFQPALSQTAIAMGATVGENLVRQARGKAPKPFQFRDAGYIISLGKHSSVLELFGVPLSGKLAWLLWAGAYLVKMVGLRKQIEVGIDHLIHFFFEHDSSQIMNRREVLSDEELNLSLGRRLPAGHEHAGAEPAVTHLERGA
jgi:NADH dehydrogenase